MIGIALGGAAGTASDGRPEHNMLNLICEICGIGITLTGSGNYTNV